MTPLLTLLPTLITLCLSSAPTLTAASPALIERNLAYRSPYLTEPGLAIDTVAVHKRHVDARAEVQQVVEERIRKRSVHEDNGEVRAPEGEPAENPLIYGLGVAVWDHDWVFGGDINFTHGVASGDPFDYSVILWTRVKPVKEGRIDIPICVTYDVYESEDATGEAVSSGYALTGPDVDYTVKVEATGLTASTKYTYVFANCAKPEQKSVVGKTRTAPGKHATNIETQRFAIYSCSNYPNGFFSAYSGPVIYGDADYAIHLGDYIYEYGSGGAGIGRVPSKNAELATLDDYRQRYAQYRTDEDLAIMHQNIPLIAIWDDHETANNDWKAGSSNSNDSLATGGCAYSNNTICFSDRAINAKRAYYEWIPIRSVDLADQGRIWRDFNFGDLLSIVALDTRKYDRDITDLSYNIDYVSELAQELDTERSIVGPKQEAWIEETLSSAQDRGTKWKLLLNQVILGSIDHRWTSQVPEKAAFITNYDAWDGYQANRRRLLSYIYDNQIDNVLAVTGDTHANWLFENSLETTYQGSHDSSTLRKLATTANAYQRGVVTEYGVTAVSSNGWGKSWGSYENSTVPAQRMVDGNPSLLYTEGYHRGYMTLNINYTHVETVWYSYPGSFTARVSNNREEAMRVVQQVDMNQIQRPLAQPRYGKVKPGNF